MERYEEWLQAAHGRLAADGFSIRENVQDGGLALRMVAHRSRFELTKFGNAETFFVFAAVQPATTVELSAFSGQAYRFAMSNRTSSLPCGLFESAWCYTVALTDALDEQAARLVAETTPPKHWASAEVPVVYDYAADELTFFRNTPLWGAAYYRGFRSSIRKYLGGQ